jgi:hypothetical protein
MAAAVNLFSEIIQIDHFNEVAKYIESDTLVILDIDDTLLVPTQMLGCDPWFIHRLNMYQQKGNYSFALDKALAEWEAVRHITKIKIVEEGTEEIIKELQNNNVMVMGLTTQGLALASRTNHQLRSLGIELDKTAPSKEDHYFINGHGVLYRRGILFTAGSPKGKALLKLLESLSLQPKHIVFVNDKETHLQDVEESLKAKKMPFTGLRYAFSDESVKNFRQDIAEIQWTHSTFSHILSDEEAELLLNTR